MVRGLGKVFELRTCGEEDSVAQPRQDLEESISGRKTATAKPWGSDINEVFFNDEAGVW